MNRRKSASNLAFAAAIVAVILLSYGWRVALLNHTFHYDEGIHLIWGKLWAEGYTPYEEIFVSYPPFFLWSLGLPWQLFQQAGALQLLMATYALTGVLAVIYLGTVYGGRLAGLTAGLLLSFAPAYFIPSIEIMGEVPSVGLAVVSVALAEKYRRSGGWVWVALAGSVLAFSLSLKILPFYAIPFVALVVAARYLEPGRWRQSLQTHATVLARDLAILAGSFVLVFGLPIILFDLPAFFRQVVGMRLVSRETELNPYEASIWGIVAFLFSNAGLMALSLYGLAFVIFRDLKKYWLLIAWLIAVWGSMNFHVPLRDKHLPILLPVLAVFAGLGVAHMLDFVRQLRSDAVTLRTLSLPLIMLVVLAIFSYDALNAMARNNIAPTSQEDNPERDIAIDFIQTITAPDECVIADNPVFLHRTNRLPPPELGEVSHTRIDTGHLTLPELVEAIQTYDCQAVAVVSPRFAQIPDLTGWLEDNYLGLHAQTETFVFFGKKAPTGDYQAVSASSPGSIRLYGFDLHQQPWPVTQDNFVSLYWQLEEPLAERPVVTLSLRDPTTDELVHQSSHPLFEGRFDPARWPVGTQARDTFRVELPARMTAGTYNLGLSLCSVNCSEIGQPQQPSEVAANQTVIGRDITVEVTDQTAR